MKQKSNNLDIRDLVNIGLFSILIFITTFLSGMIGFIPSLMPIVPLINGIIVGPLYMLFSTKIKKPWMLFIQTIIITLVFVATGHGPWVILTAIFSGLLGELILRNGKYGSIKTARYAFTIQSLYGVGNWLPIFFARNAYIKQLTEMGYSEEFIYKMMSVLPNWSLVFIIISGMVGTYIGCSIGILMLRKHFIKAGMAEDA